MSFVKTNTYDFLENFFKDDMFFNIYVVGPKGAGKTRTILKIHENLDRPIYRVNISIETDEDSLIGGFRLKNGETVFDYGPVIRAMKEGATLLLDEIDLGHPQRLMCLQSILEGSGYHIKRTDERIFPKKGFKIIATANTKGAGDETGQYVGTQILNAAMKDRFSIFYEFDYPSESVEKEILSDQRSEIEEELDIIGTKKFTDDMIGKVVKWSAKIRQNMADDTSEDIISTRKLIDIVKCFYYVGDLQTAIKYSIAGYPKEYVDAFMNAYDLINDDAKPDAKPEKKKSIVF